MSLKLYRTLLQLRARFADVVDSWLRLFPAYRDYQRTQKLLTINLSTSVFENWKHGGERTDEKTEARPPLHLCA